MNLVIVDSSIFKLINKLEEKIKELKINNYEK
jgi:hypothetical protein